MKTLAAAVLLALLAGWLAWPASSGRWRPFSAPELVQVVALGDVEMTANLQLADGRILAARALDLVFRRSAEPRELTVVAPQGSQRLFFGDDGPALVCGEAELRLENAGPAASATLSADEAAGSLTLRCADGQVTVLAGTRTLLQGTWAGPVPSGRVGVRLAPRSSLRELTLVGGDGRQTLRDEQSGESLAKPTWAAAAVLLLVPSLVALWRRRVRGEARGGVLAALGGAALVAGLCITLWAQNRERLRPPDAACATAPFALPAPRRVELFAPWGGPGRVDGDFELSAELTLDPDSVVDLLLRGAPSDRDRGVVVSLSSDARLSSGLALNLATEWRAEPAPAALATLPAGRPLHLDVEAQGAEVVARVDGETLGTLRDLDLRAGRTAVQALAGGASLQSLSIAPQGAPGDLVGLLGRWMAGAALAALAGLALLAWLLRSRVAAGLLVAPLAVSCWPLAPAPLLGGAILVTLALAPWVAPAGRRLGALLVVAALGALAARVAAEVQPSYSPTILNDMTLEDVRGGPLPADYLWARHPLCRRFSTFVRDQQFRSGPVARERPAGTKWRIVTLGSSSTFGYGLDEQQTWSAWLEKRFGGEAEVVNAGTPGATAERLRPLLDDVLLKLQPDLVIIDLSFNDHVQGPMHDERAYFARFTGEGVSFLEQCCARWRAWRRQAGWRDYFHARQVGETPDAADVERFETGPTARFADSLRDLARAATAAGARVILVAEPARPGLDDPTLLPFRATVKAVGAELGLPVADPQPALDQLGASAFIDAVHPTEAGHRALAAEIVDVIVREGLLKQRR
ncbi:MAG TPA: GDSL-type esterase/lipase family protein [Planctomycetota bacterium]|nr:GDSL-type esterase/lipase family protein [Planctomycetota bacterium]